MTLSTFGIYHFSIVLETPHVIVGAAIATKVVHPALAIPLAMGSHFILDMIPHWNPHLHHEKIEYGHFSKKSIIIVVTDSTVALLVGSFIAFKALPNTALALTIFFSCFAAVLPDLIEAPYYFLNKKSKLIEKWIDWQRSIQATAKEKYGFITQILVIVFALWWMSVK